MKFSKSAARNTFFSGVLVAAFFSVLSAWSAHAAIILVCGSSGDVYSVDTSTGLATKVAETPILSDIAFDSSGNLWGIQYAPYPDVYNSNLYTIDLTSGTPTLVGSYNTIYDPNALVVEPQGGPLLVTGYGMNSSRRYIYSFDLSGGVSTTNIGSTGLPSAGDLEFDGNGDLYLAVDYGATDRLILLSKNSGTGKWAAAGLRGDSGFDNLNGLAYVDGIMYGFSGLDILTIDLSTGAATKINTINFDGPLQFALVYGAAVAAQAKPPLPVPATMLLLGTN